MWTLDVGCAMGFFSFPMAEMVGESGRVVCVDVQEGMIEELARRVRMSPTYKRFDIRMCSKDTLGLADLREEIDFALASAVMHETSDQELLLAEIRQVLKPGGALLVLEPRGHVSASAMEETISRARHAGFAEAGGPTVKGSRTGLFVKK